MRRIASHYIYWRQFYRMHYVELDDSGILTGVFPLEGEIAERKQEVQTYIFLLVPLTLTLTDLTLDFQTALLLLWEWLTLFPK